jgi:hypothetical protein
MAAFLLFGAASRPAEAQQVMTDGAEPLALTAALDAPAPGASAHPWYGWQTLTSDGVSVGLLVAGLGSDGHGAAAGLTVAGLSGFGLGAPIIHAAHGRWLIAGADLGMRVGSVLIAGIVGAEIGTAAGPSSAQCGATAGTAPFATGGCPLQQLSTTLEGWTIGAFVGGGIASVIDAALFAHDPVPAKEAPRPSFSWSPSIAPLRSGASAGVAGTF